MRKLYVSLATIALVSLAFLVRGQSTEAFAAGTNDVLRSAHVYPNPAVDYIHLKFEQPIAREVTLEMHSIIGNNLDVEMEVMDDYEVRVRVKDLPSGYYLMDVKKPGMTHHAFKFLKR
jgi:Secretion system C-terminal sorting domain